MRSSFRRSLPRAGPWTRTRRISSPACSQSVVAYGTARRAQSFGRPIAGKTGTTNAVQGRLVRRLLDGHRGGGVGRLRRCSAARSERIRRGDRASRVDRVHEGGARGASADGVLPPEHHRDGARRSFDGPARSRRGQRRRRRIPGRHGTDGNGASAGRGRAEAATTAAYGQCHAARRRCGPRRAAAVLGVAVRRGTLACGCSPPAALLARGRVRRGSSAPGGALAGAFARSRGKRAAGRATFCRLAMSEAPLDVHDAHGRPGPARGRDCPSRSGRRTAEWRAMSLERENHTRRGRVSRRL